jgi:hypothetical protein
MSKGQSFNAMKAVLDDHARDIGYIVIAWNALHENLGKLFGAIVARIGTQAALAAWNALTNDRTQRYMLQAATSAGLPDKDPLRSEILWALGQITPLANNRNDALHAPYAVLFEEGRVRVVPSTSGGNKRATNLLGRDLGVELASYRNRIEALSDFVLALWMYFLTKDEGGTLPDRPQPPRSAHRPSKKARPRPKSGR